MVRVTAISALTVAWWLLAWLFLGLLFAVGWGALRDHYDRRVDRMSEQWRERWHREHR